MIRSHIPNTLTYLPLRTDITHLQHPPEYVPQMLASLSPSAQFVLGTRYGGGAGAVDEGWPLYRRVISGGARMLALPLTSASDPMSGFFGIRKESVRIRCWFLLSSAHLRTSTPTSHRSFQPPEHPVVPESAQPGHARLQDRARAACQGANPGHRDRRGAVRVRLARGGREQAHRQGHAAVPRTARGAVLVQVQRSGCVCGAAAASAVLPRCTDGVGCVGWGGDTSDGPRVTGARAGERSMVSLMRECSYVFVFVYMLH